MFARLAALATLALPLASAMTLNTPTGATTGGVITITWTATTSDPSVFSLELVNTAFHNTFAIANSIQTSLLSLTLELPQIPVGDGYTIEAIQQNDINVVLATSGDFSVGAQTTSSASMSGSMTSGTATGTSVAGSSATAPVATSSASSSASPSPTSINNTGAAASHKFSMAPAAAILLSGAAAAVML